MNPIAIVEKALKYVILSYLAGLLFSCGPQIHIEDENGIFGKLSAPVAINVDLEAEMLGAAAEGRLGIKISSSDGKETNIVPAQWKAAPNENKSVAVFLMPAIEKTENITLSVQENAGSFENSMMVSEELKTGQINFTESGQPVLRYNYQTVYEDDEFAFNGLAANEYVVTENDTFMANPSIYAVPRSNYIHPVFGLEGEILTRDWSRDHPHHRGIYWAWPEVDFGTQRSDLHALQKVFARPTGRIKIENGPVFAQVEAENLWLMENGMVPIVRELTLIRAYRQSKNIRIIDLIYKFIGLRDSVTIARRGTNAYGGLNIRMMTPESQELSYHTDDQAAVPRRAWSDLSGLFSGAKKPSGLMVLQHQKNPEYPGEWVEYPELSWVQPTFPTSGTRYPLKEGESLVLQFRLVVHTGAKPDITVSQMQWDALHASQTPELEFVLD